MRCEMENCVWNDEGYCLRDSYVTINQNAECSEYNPRPSIDLGLKKKEADD